MTLPLNVLKRRFRVHGPSVIYYVNARQIG
jgi:hypothetical protein